MVNIHKYIHGYFIMEVHKVNIGYSFTKESKSSPLVGFNLNAVCHVLSYSTKKW